MFHKMMQLAVAALLLAMFSFSGSAYAEINVAVVDVDKILNESKAAKSVQKQVESKREEFLKSVKGEEDKLRKEEKEIIEKRAKLTQEEMLAKKEEFIAEAQKFEKLRMEARNKIQSTKNKLDKAYAEAMVKLSKAIYDVCEKIAEEKKYDLIITQKNIIIGNKSLEITSEVMKKLDEKLPTLALDVK